VTVYLLKFEQPHSTWLNYSKPVPDAFGEHIDHKRLDTYTINTCSCKREEMLKWRDWKTVHCSYLAFSTEAARDIAYLYVKGTKLQTESSDAHYLDRFEKELSALLIADSTLPFNEHRQKRLDLLLELLPTIRLEPIDDES
jgi:hypothetical protein